MNEMRKEIYNIPCMCIGGWCGCKGSYKFYIPYISTYIHYEAPIYKINYGMLSETIQQNCSELDEAEITVEEAKNLIKSCEDQIKDFPKDYMRIEFGSKYRPYSDRLKSKHNHKKECFHHECVLKKLQQVITNYNTYSEYVADNTVPFSKVSRRKTRLVKKDHDAEYYVRKQLSKLCLISKKQRIFNKKNKHEQTL